jgi:hypothetical protein
MSRAGLFRLAYLALARRESAQLKSKNFQFPLPPTDLTTTTGNHIFVSQCTESQTKWRVDRMYSLNFLCFTSYKESPAKSVVCCESEIYSLEKS